MAIPPFSSHMHSNGPDTEMMRPKERKKREHRKIINVLNLKYYDIILLIPLILIRKILLDKNA